MLTEREETVLREIIELFVETAQPVGSRTVARRLNIALSPATIRNTMMDLEDKGFLGQPHTSAGRVPTDQAYRKYVDSLMQPQPMTAEEEGWIDEQLAHTAGHLASLFEQTARLLAAACRQLGLVQAPTFARGVLTGLEFVRVSDQRVLVVLQVAEGPVRTVLLDVSSRLDPDTLARTASRLNEYLVGLTLEEIQRTLAERVRVWDLGDDEIAMRLVEMGPALFGGEDPHALYVGGTTNIVSQPEFRSAERLTPLLSVLEDRAELVGILGRRTLDNGLHITIGRENPEKSLAGVSVVACTYTTGALHGAIGVIGPTRMPYRRVVGVLQRVVDQIHQRRFV